MRKAAMHDIGPILGLINGYAAKGVMLPRTELEVSEDIRDFSVIVAGGRTGGLRRAALLFAIHRAKSVRWPSPRTLRLTASAGG